MSAKSDFSKIITQVYHPSLTVSDVKATQPLSSNEMARIVQSMSVFIEVSRSPHNRNKIEEIRSFS